MNIELATVEAVWNTFERRWGYEISDVSKANKGWDLEAVRGNERLKIEVKGCSGSIASAELTPKEYHHARKHRDYRICIVTNALLKPEVHIFSPFLDGSWWDESGERQLVLEERKAARLSVI